MKLTVELGEATLARLEAYLLPDGPQQAGAAIARLLDLADQFNLLDLLLQHEARDTEVKPGDITRVGFIRTSWKKGESNGGT